MISPAPERSGFATRRSLIAAAAASGAAPLLAGVARASEIGRREVRAAFPQGVASGDPDANSVIIWTRRDPAFAPAPPSLLAEVAEDPEFARVVATRRVRLIPGADGTCRAIVAGLRPSTHYWYRFTDLLGCGSRVGRTCTAPHTEDPRPVSFAFVSCQNVNLGPLTAWRRMVFDDRGATKGEEIEFVLHLGDFVYDDVWSSADNPAGYLDRKVQDILYPVGERRGDVHVAVNLEDYRTLYRTYLLDEDLQEARARWPFVAIWDNGEFSDKGWQGLQRFGDVTRAAQTRKVAANQAWFEYLPSRARTRDGSLTSFAAPKVADAPIAHFDPDGLGVEPNNLAAIESLTGYRKLRWGRHVELIITDQRSYRSEDYTAAPEAKAIASKLFYQMVPFEALEQIDAGRTWGGGRPPDRLLFAEADTANYRKEAAPRTLLGAAQKKWFLDSLRRSTATWKIWGNTVATLDMRADPQNLPANLAKPWPGAGYAGFARTDFSTAFTERAEIYDAIAQHGVSGFVTLSGDRHSFWAGYAAKALPPKAFEPVGLSFVVGSVSSPGMVEAFEHVLPKQHPLRALYLIDRPGASKPEPSVNLLFRHGVATCLEYAASGDLKKAVALSNPMNAPHVNFVDMGGHGYSKVTASALEMSVEFACIARPVEANDAADGGPLRYRIVHHAKLWSAGEAPKLSMALMAGDVGLSV